MHPSTIPDGDTLLRALAPRPRSTRAARQRQIIAALGPALLPTLDQYLISTPLRIAHFLAQAAHECDGFQTTEEYASGSAYEGRRFLGNVRPGDGRRYKGRGIFQLTGRANYRTYGVLLGLDLETEPERAAEPVTSLRIACEYWRQHGLNALADADDLVGITRRINGGTNGLDDRRRYLGVAKRTLGIAPVLEPGARGADVVALQTALRGVFPGLALDGSFGPRTSAALRKAQEARGLPPTGTLDAATAAALGLTLTT